MTALSNIEKEIFARYFEEVCETGRVLQHLTCVCAVWLYHNSGSMVIIMPACSYEETCAMYRNAAIAICHGCTHTTAICLAIL